MAIELRKRQITISVLTIKGCTIPADKDGDIRFLGNQSPVKIFPRLYISTQFINKNNIEKVKVRLSCAVCDATLFKETADTDAYSISDISSGNLKAIKCDEHYVLFCKDMNCDKIYSMAPFSYEDKIEKSKMIKVPKEIDPIV